MSEWDHLFKANEHVLRDPDVFVIHFARIMRSRGLRTILDWGCGAGRHVVYLSREGFQVSGMDPSPTALQIASDWLKREGLTASLEYVQPGSIPSPPSAFDAVISLFAIEHGNSDDIENSLEEINRVLKKGAMLLVTLSSGEDSMKISSEEVEGEMYAPISGPEAGIPHFLSSREEIDHFFRNFEMLELSHLCSRLGILDGQERIDAHWVVIARKKH